MKNFKAEEFCGFLPKKLYLKTFTTYGMSLSILTYAMNVKCKTFSHKSIKTAKLFMHMVCTHIHYPVPRESSYKGCYLLSTAKINVCICISI